MSEVNIIQGEAKVLPFLIKSKKTGRALDVSGATFLLYIKVAKDSPLPIIMKTDAQFDKSFAGTGRVSVWLSTENTNQEAPWTYYGELRVTMATTPATIYKLPFELDIDSSEVPPDSLNIAASEQTRSQEVIAEI